jgi:5,10-methylenetetrahydrofolate reductase
MFIDLGVKFNLFDRLISSRHFEKLKGLLNVKTPQELKDVLATIQEGDKEHGELGYSQSFDRVVKIYKLIDLQKIATTR